MNIQTSPSKQYARCASLLSVCTYSVCDPVQCVSLLSVCPCSMCIPIGCASLLGMHPCSVYTPAPSASLLGVSPWKNFCRYIEAPYIYLVPPNDKDQFVNQVQIKCLLPLIIPRGFRCELRKKAISTELGESNLPARGTYSYLRGIFKTNQGYIIFSWSCVSRRESHETTSAIWTKPQPAQRYGLKSPE